MDLRNLPENLDGWERIARRRSLIQDTLGMELSAVELSPEQAGAADEKNCEQMFGAVPVPIGLAGPLQVIFSSNEKREVYLPLATTEAALVASVNRGAKAISASGGAQTSSKYLGITRSIAFEIGKNRGLQKKVRALTPAWKKIAESTSSHLKVLAYNIETSKGVLFLTIAADTGEAMGMNMITIAAQAVGEFISKELNMAMLSVAGNVDSDKKPSMRTKKKGRGFIVTAEAVISEKVLREVLKIDSVALIKTARAKLIIGSHLAGALGSNLHAANIVAALYLATGQDVAHVVEASLADTKVVRHGKGIKITLNCPAILVGTRGGGTELSAQRQCLDLVMKPMTKLRPTAQLAETMAAAVLAGELSLLAAQATNSLAYAHGVLSGRGR